MASVINGTEKYGVGKEYLKPDAGDDGETWATVIETFMERIATHTHNGQDSESIVITVNKNIPPDLSFLEAEYSTPIAGVFRTPTIPYPNGADRDSVKQFFEVVGSSIIEVQPTVTEVSGGYNLELNSKLLNIRVYYY